MPGQLQTFWTDFNNKHFSDAADTFVKLDETQQQNALAELFHKSQYHRKPEIVSLLRRVLRDDQDNQARHDKISQVADTELLGIAKVETDDNLGTPF